MLDRQTTISNCEILISQVKRRSSTNEVGPSASLKIGPFHVNPAVISRLLI